jgi:hypothetical protein
VACRALSGLHSTSCRCSARQPTIRSRPDAFLVDDAAREQAPDVAGIRPDAGSVPANEERPRQEASPSLSSA